MGIASRLKQIHSDNIGTSTLLIIAVVFAGLTWLIFQTIESIIERPDSLMQVAPAAAAEATTPPTDPAAAPAADARN
jgi:hypothetical protein